MITDPVFGIPLDLLVLTVAVVLDLTLGEPPNRLHPTVWMGHSVSLAEKLAPSTGNARQLLYGALMAVVIPAGWGAAAYFAAQGLLSLHPLAYVLLGALILKPTFAIRMLHRAAARVRALLLAGDLAGVRAGMSSLVSRDPSSLDAREATAGVVESVAENMTDSFVAPLLAFALFGLPGAVAYRAMNTLDSMVGYHGRYEYLGKASARLDDLVNLIPARLSALLVVLTGAVTPRGSMARAWRIMRRDHGTTESPNAGWTMSAMAGMLGVVLDKPGHYRLGDDSRPLEPHDISRAVRSMYTVAGLGLLLAIGIIFLRHAIF
jgi:adenosylcobinamide-phosphate synthase